LTVSYEDKVTQMSFYQCCKDRKRKIEVKYPVPSRQLSFLRGSDFSTDGTI
jgi:hypothetical protein